MINPMKQLLQRAGLLIVLATLWVGFATQQVAAAQLPTNTCTATGTNSRTCDLWAKSGSITVAGNASPITIWGYADSAAGAATLPGPLLIVNQGESVTINLTNLLPESTALAIPGLNLRPDLVGVATNGSKSYTFVANEAGTFLYEAGLLSNAQHQVAMGLYGALIVRPSVATQANANATSAFDDEALVLLSEIDLNLNNSANPAAFDMRNYNPRFRLINGKAHPNTDEIQTLAGSKVLLRYINAGLQYHSMSLLGKRQTLLAMDGVPYLHPRSLVAQTLPPGSTMDTLVTTSPTLSQSLRYAIYDANLQLNNNGSNTTGGMVAFINTVVDTQPPVVSNLTLTPSAADLIVSALADDSATGNSRISAAEYWIDAGAPVAMSASDGNFNAAVETIQTTISAATLDALTTGTHTVFVRAQDRAGNWSAPVSATFFVDNTPPSVSNLVLTANAGNLDISALVDDSLSGNSNIAAAEYVLDNINATPIALAAADAAFDSPSEAVQATISAATLASLSQGVHTVFVRGQDSAGNWSGYVQAIFTIDTAGPDTSAVSASPNPSNGSSDVAIAATADDSANGNHNISAAEYFVDSVGADGSGQAMTVASATPVATLNGVLSLATIAGLSDGTHTIYVHAQDAVGNWGATASTILTIDKTAAVVADVTLTPNPTVGAATVSLTATASDATSAVTQAEWFIGVDPGVGNGNAATVTANGTAWDLAATIDSSALANGTYTVNVRAKDAAGNWSVVATATLEVSPAFAPGDINADGFVNVLDLQILINMILNTTQPDVSQYDLDWWQRADLSPDSAWNVLDLQTLINLILAAIG